MNIRTNLVSIGLAASAVTASAEGVSFEKAEGWVSGKQAHSDRMDWTAGTATVVTGVAPDGSAYLKFEGGSFSDLALVSLDAPTGTVATDLRVFVRPPFTEGAGDCDLVFFGGAIIGVAQQDGQIRLSLPLDAQGATWRDFTIARDPFTDTAPAEWTELVVHRDAARGTWDLSLGSRVIATSLPLATEAIDDDVFGVCGLGPVGVDAIRAQRQPVSVSVAPGLAAKTGSSVRPAARQKVTDLVAKFDKARTTGASAAPNLAKAAAPATAATAKTAAAPAAVRLELFLPKP